VSFSRPLLPGRGHEHRVSRVEEPACVVTGDPNNPHHAVPCSEDLWSRATPLRGTVIHEILPKQGPIPSGDGLET
jgi:hypothetical protein